MMLPTHTRFYSAYGICTNAIIKCNESLQAGILSNRINLYASKFSCATILSAISSPMSNSIGLVILSCIPSKITQMIILWITVIMATLHSFWSFAYKCLQDKFMWFNLRVCVVFPQSSIRTTVMFTNCHLFDCIGFYGKNSAVVRNFVKTFKADYITPFFHHIPLMYSKGRL